MADYTRRKFIGAGTGALAAATAGGVLGRPAVVEALSATNPADLTVLELLPLLQGRKLSARELLAACFARIDALEPAVMAFVTQTRDLAQQQAAAIDAARAAGRPVGPLAGIPVGLKDLYYTAGIKTTASSRVLADFVPDFDATVWARLRDAGCVLLGKLVTHEFAYGTSSPPTRNPWDLSRNPGGSSGGPAAALAARMMPLATGTDTGGSLRIPSAACGVTAMRMTYGRSSRHGVITLSWSLDTTGTMARRLGDVAYSMQVVGGPDPADPTTIPQPLPALPQSASPDLRGVRLGVPTSYFWDGIDSEILRICQQAVETCKGLGATVVPTPIPASSSAVMATIGAYEVVNLVEASSYHEQLMKERAAYYSPEVYSLLVAGLTYKGVDYVDNQRLRSIYGREWRQIFRDNRLDAVIHPTIPQPPGPQVPSESFAVGPTIGLTKAWSNNGFPSLSVPVGLDNRGLPVGLLFAALPLQEARLLGVALALEAVIQFWKVRPALLQGVP